MDIIKEIYEDNDFFDVGEIFVPIFKKNIKVYINKSVSKEYRKLCIMHLIALDNSVLNEFEEKAFKHYKFMMEEWKTYGIFDEIIKNIPPNLKKENILQYINNPIMFINLPNENIPAYNIECECLWEPEHGLDWIIKENKTLYVGEPMGLGPWLENEDYKCIYD